MSGGDGEPPSEVVVRAATSQDAGSVADLHVRAISEGFLASLGPRFLRRLYARIAKSPHGFLLVACDPGHGPWSGLSPVQPRFAASMAISSCAMAWLQG